jgi:putative lipoic acid-binding regulatory protein
MEILNENSENKPKIDYPTDWQFKIIGRDRDALLRAIKEVMGDKEHSHHFGNLSKNGKFCSYNTSCEVESQDERDKIFKAFRDHKDIDMVI